MQREASRSLAALVAAGLCVTFLVGERAGRVTAQEPRPVSPICTLAFEEALGPASGGPAMASASPPATTPSATSVPLELPSSSPEPHVSPRPLPQPAILDAAIRSCASIEEFEAAAAGYPRTFEDAGPRAFLAARCADPDAGLDAYATCASLALALASPAATSSPPPVGPDGAEEPTSPESPDPRDLDRPSGRMSARIPGATRIRYFRIQGDGPNELIAHASRKAGRYCPMHASACVQYRPNVRARTQTNTATGECRIIGVTTSLTADVFLPRWTAPAGSERALVAWWRKMFRRIAAHEAEHIRIAQRALETLPRRLVGRSCTSFASVYPRWSRSLTRQQDRFDERDRDRPLPPYRGS